MDGSIKEYTQLNLLFAENERVIKETVFGDIVEITSCNLNKDKTLVLEGTILIPKDDTFIKGEPVLVNYEDTRDISSIFLDLIKENEVLKEKPFDKIMRVFFDL